MKKVISIAGIILMLLLLGSCGEAKPEDTVSRFFSAAQKFDAQTMISTLVPSNKDDASLIRNVTEGSQNEFDKYFVEYLKGNAKKMTFSVTESKINGDTALVTVKCRYVDGGPVLKGAIGSIYANEVSFQLSGNSLTQEKENEIIKGIIDNQIRLSGEKYVEATIQVNCYKQVDKWYIVDVNEEMYDAVASGFLTAWRDLQGSH